jgi:hypothetical protein
MLLAGPERRLGGPPLGEISGDFGKPDEIAGGVADGIDDDIGPKPAAVFADPPALALELSLACRHGEDLCG